MISERKKLFDELSAAKLRKPFVPFAIVLRNGKRYEIKDRWHVGFAEGNPHIAARPSGGSNRFLTWNDVAAIEPQGAAAAGTVPAPAEAAVDRAAHAAEASARFAEAYRAVTREPFEPFVIVLRDGRRYTVSDRRHMALAEGNSHAVVLPDESASHEFFVWEDVAAVMPASPGERKPAS